MVAIQGLGGIPEPKPEQPSKVRKDRDTASVSSTAGGTTGQDQDEFVISSEARAAAVVAKTIAAAASQADIRADKVAAAKENLERGDYKDPERVAKTAEKLLKYIS